MIFCLFGFGFGFFFPEYYLLVYLALEMGFHSLYSQGWPQALSLLPQTLEVYVTLPKLC